MQVPCARGRNCPGSSLLGAPECFLSEKSTRAPYFLRRAMGQALKNKGFLVRFLGEYGMHSAGIMYHFYQCAACGCRVVFMEKPGGGFERIYDDLMDS